MNYTIINEAIRDCLPVGGDNILNYKRNITGKYGKEILNSILEILDFAYATQPDWSTESFFGFLDRVYTSIENEYPWLEKESVQALRNRVGFNWR